jgi:hypothetical protein
VKRNKQPVLACIAPDIYKHMLREELDIQFHRRSSPDLTEKKPKLSNDPYAIGPLAKTLSGNVDGILLVAPLNRSPHRTIPGPLIHNLPVGIIFSNQPEDLQPWVNSLRNQNNGSPVWAVLSKWNDYFLTRSQRVAKWLRGSNPHQVETWFADDFTRDELCERLATGPRLTWYMGHSRSRGLSAYHGVRWPHLAEITPFSPCGTVISLSCDTLKRERGIFPFGCQWVFHGRAAAFFGSVDSISMKSTLSLAYEIGFLFEKKRVKNIGELIVKLENRLHSNPYLSDTYRAFKSYRIIGNPVQTFF